MPCKLDSIAKRRRLTELREETEGLQEPGYHEERLQGLSSSVDEENVPDRVSHLPGGFGELNNLVVGAVERESVADVEAQQRLKPVEYLEIPYELLGLPGSLAKLCLLPLLAEVMEIVADEAEAEHVISPRFFLQKQLPVDVLVAVRVHDLFISEHNDVSPVTDLRELDDASGTHQNHDGKDAG
eukprot:CAMPEP_0170484856 /NCGR_PEP_ID=MMETSP0208-20121228/4227_1 /TAXON_ID=197538 /ORGANISM="Strombidium inclinatum, Strain S3" /LENGTH=183 /DNA_ID=CAMNT_0010758305 /DNA_START=1157 /DNA_END=1708 /DNA_ORIENTATION=-